jgi:hypothetical protein
LSAYTTIKEKYGLPDAAYQSKYCMLWNVQQDFPWFPAKKIFINKEFQLKLTKAFYNLEKTGIHIEIKSFDGCYNERAVRGASVLSLHAYAMAMDLNAESEKLGQEQTNFSGQFIAIMKAAGLFWGGDYLRRKDPMHFGLYNG